VKNVEARKIVLRTRGLQEFAADGKSEADALMKRTIGIRDTLSRHLRLFDGKPHKEARAVLKLAKRNGWTAKRKGGEAA
jgi:hypothetical protein